MMDMEGVQQDRSDQNIGFPLFVYDDRIYKNKIISCHWHSEFELLLVTKGEVQVQVGTSYYKAAAGQVVFINSTEIHAVYSVENIESTCIPILVNPSMLYSASEYDLLQNKYFTPILRKKYKLPVLITGEDQRAAAAIRRLQELYDLLTEKPQAYELMVKSKLYEFFFNVIPLGSFDENASTDENSDIERIKRVLSYIQENYDRKLTINELAQVLNMSNSHFCRFFKKLVQKTPIEYINYYRVTKAAVLLRETSKKEIEVALDTGYDNFSYFISVFKKLTKCTPSEYRKKSSEDAMTLIEHFH